MNNFIYCNILIYIYKIYEVVNKMDDLMDYSIRWKRGPKCTVF